MIGSIVLELLIVDRSAWTESASSLLRWRIAVSLLAAVGFLLNVLALPMVAAAHHTIRYSLYFLGAENLYRLVGASYLIAFVLAVTLGVVNARGGTRSSPTAA